MSLILADARSIPLRDGCVQCVVTSPPYFGLRDFGVRGQIGLEPTPDEYVAQIVAVFREVRRVLADDGVLWLNLGDSHATNVLGGAKPKDMLGIPWRVAFALQADGWYLRSDIIWHKPNPMPESVTDRPTKAHEYLFLLAKSERYYYDADAIKEPVTGGSHRRGSGVTPKSHSPGAGVKANTNYHAAMTDLVDERNKRSVWSILSQAYQGAHFATMPEALVEPCILAGSRPGDRVFDPFIGSGTVGAVAERLGRQWVGLDLNPAYHALAKKRTAQRGLFVD